MKPANTNALPVQKPAKTISVGRLGIPSCEKCSPKARRKQQGSAEWLEYTFQVPCGACARSMRLAGFGGRHVSKEQSEAVIHAFGLAMDVLLLDFGGPVECVPTKPIAMVKGSP